MRYTIALLTLLLTGCGTSLPRPAAAPASTPQAESLLGGYLAATARIGEQYAIHHPRERPKSAPLFPYDEVHTTTGDGLRLTGWYVPAARPTKKTVVLVHGHADSRYAFLRDGQLAMLQPDYNLVAFDLRNCGDSDGTATTFGLNEALDVIAAVAYAEQRGAEAVSLYGMSLGAVSCLNALDRLPEVKSVMLDCPFASVRAAFTGFAAAAWEPNPVLVGGAILELANRDLGLDLADGEGLRHIGAVGDRPLWMVHGAADTLVLPDESRALYGLAPTADKSLWIVPGAGHGQSIVAARAEYAARLRAFLGRTL